MISTAKVEAGESLHLAFESNINWRLAKEVVRESTIWLATIN